MITETEGSAPEREHCVLHPFETTDRVCHECGRWHCDGCLVSPWGPRKPSLCIQCALGRSGVRRSAGAGKVRTPREIREIEKAQRRTNRDEPDQRSAAASQVGAEGPEPDDAGRPRRLRLRRSR